MTIVSEDLTITLSVQDLQAYEAALCAFLEVAHAIATQLKQERHTLATSLGAELHKAVMAQGSWRAARWVARAAQLG
jgi:hypothetical protein